MKTDINRIPLVLTLIVAMIVAGCVPSLNPLYTDKDVVFEPALVGVWAEKEDSEETWAFEKAGDKAYKLVYTEKGKKGEFKVHLVKLGNTLFLDLYPDDTALKEIDRNDFYKSHLLLAHTFAKVTQIEPRLQMAFFNPDWLKKLLEKDPKAVRHEKIDEDRIVLTASTKELQGFVLEHANTKDAFGDEPSNLKRIKSKP